MFRRLLPAMALLVAACQSNDVIKDNEPNLRTLSATESGITTASNEFAFNLFNKLQKSQPENSFLSPLSIGTALAMTLNGAEGETQQSILNTIDFGAFSAEEVNQAYRDLTALLMAMDHKVQLGIANSVWYNNKYHVQDAFSATINEYYDGKVEGLDFKDGEGSANTINSWVEDKTSGRIKDLISEVQDIQVMFLVNAIYFKGDWTYQFEKSKTRQATFFKPGGDSNVDLMFSKGVKMNVYSNDEFQLVDIPYGNQQFSFTVLMPHNPANFATFVNGINESNVDFWLSQADSTTRELELPRFKMDWKMDLKDTLHSMGMKLTDFPKLFQENLALEISAVVHQSFIEVNEEGSEAAAATAVVIQELSAVQNPPKITIDKSFVFMIRERHTGAVLFIGQLVDPAALK
jgi:serpin B